MPDMMPRVSIKGVYRTDLSIVFGQTFCYIND